MRAYGSEYIRTGISIFSKCFKGQRWRIGLRRDRCVIAIVKRGFESLSKHNKNSILII